MKTSCCFDFRDCKIYLRDVRSNEPFESRFSAHKQEVCGLKWSTDDDRVLASGGNDNKVMLRPSSLQRIHKKQLVHLDPVTHRLHLGQASMCGRFDNFSWKCWQSECHTNKTQNFYVHSISSLCCFHFLSICVVVAVECMQKFSSDSNLLRTHRSRESHCLVPSPGR